jgi:hypothetical protein
MKNKNLYIGVGIALVVVYFLMRKKKSAPSVETTKSADAPTLSDETKAAIKLMEGKGIMPPTTSTCGCGSGQKPCPNVRCARKSSISNSVNPKVSTATPTLSNETETFAFNLTF